MPVLNQVRTGVGQGPSQDRAQGIQDDVQAIGPSPRVALRPQTLDQGVARDDCAACQEQVSQQIERLAPRKRRETEHAVVADDGERAETTYRDGAWHGRLPQRRLRWWRLRHGVRHPGGGDHDRTRCLEQVPAPIERDTGVSPGKPEIAYRPSLLHQRNSDQGADT